MFHGIDVSGWQGDIDWKAVAADPQDIGFALVKATEGGHIIETDSRGYLDREFQNNWRKATEVGLIVGAYHVARVSNETGTGGYQLLMDARSEASWFWKVLKEIGWDANVNIPPVLELRRDRRATAAGITAGETRDWALEFLSTMADFCGRKPLVYATPGFWRQRLLEDPGMRDYPLWESDIEHPAGNPRTLADWSWLFHQYSFKGRVQGIAGNVGMNVFRGTRKTLRHYIDLDVRPDEKKKYREWDPPAPLGLPVVDLSGDTEPSGRAVERLQALLMGHGYGPSGLVADDGLPSGQGGPLTKEAVGRFQRDAGLDADFQVGPQTWWALIARGLADD